MPPMGLGESKNKNTEKQVKPEEADIPPQDGGSAHVITGNDDHAVNLVEVVQDHSSTLPDEMRDSSLITNQPRESTNEESVVKNGGNDSKEPSVNGSDPAKHDVLEEILLSTASMKISGVSGETSSTRQPSDRDKGDARNCEKEIESVKVQHDCKSTVNGIQKVCQESKLANASVINGNDDAKANNETGKASEVVKLTSFDQELKARDNHVESEAISKGCKVSPMPDETIVNHATKSENPAKSEKPSNTEIVGNISKLEKPDDIQMVGNTSKLEKPNDNEMAENPGNFEASALDDSNVSKSTEEHQSISSSDEHFSSSDDK